MAYDYSLFVILGRPIRKCPQWNTKAAENREGSANYPLTLEYRAKRNLPRRPSPAESPQTNNGYNDYLLSLE
jgi:hypothetical protein